MGLGDALYLQSVARHLVETGWRPEVCTAWPDVFRPLWGRINISPFRRTQIDRLAHYSLRKAHKTDQFVDCCVQAEIVEPIDLRLDWRVMNRGLVDRLKNIGRPIVCVQLPRAPMGRVDGYGMELLPDCRVLQRAIDAVKERAFVVQIGSGEALHRFSGIDLDLAGKTSVCDLIDVASVANGFLGYVSFVVPLAESLGKPALLVWSRRGLKSRTDYIRTITPAKIFHGNCCRAVIDDCSERDLAVTIGEFLDQVAGPGAL